MSVTASFALPVAGQDVGYRSLSFGVNGTSTPTGEKPESKLWFNDGFWWASLWNDSLQDYHLYRADLAHKTWVDTGTLLDSRNGKGDVLWDAASQKLYLATHIFTTIAEPTASNWGRLFRYSYNAVSKSYAPDSGFPVDITRGDAEALTMAKDSTGRLWATWVQLETVGGTPRVWVNHSTTGEAVWGLPYVLPVSSTAATPTDDDISGILAFGGNKVGVMWSNQSTATTYFAVHQDGNPDNVWTLETVVPGSGCSGACSDDHLSLKTDGVGRVFATIKTSLNDVSSPNPDAPLIMLVVRAVNGAWTGYPFGRVRDRHTRPILQLDEANEEVYVFATTPESGGGVYYKKSSMDNVQFPLGLGTRFIETAADIKTNNATSSKQNPTSASGILVLASDQDTRFYLQNHLTLAAQPGGPQIASFSPSSGPVGTPVTINGSGFTGTTAVAFNGTAAGFTVGSDAQLTATVPSGATTGTISVTTPAGTGTSSSDFAVTVPGTPVISSFSPSSGPTGTLVTVNGSDFSGATGVAFNGAAAAFNVISDAQLTATVPSGATTGRISVTKPEGTGISSTDFTVTAPPGAPSIDSFSPLTGAAGTVVTINGSNFTGATSVSFNGTEASFTIVSGAQIKATVPAGAITGKISVTTPVGTATSSSDFTVGPVKITSFSPSSGGVGTKVTILGSHFTGATKVTFHDVSASSSVISDTEITAFVPATSSGTIKVTTPAGTAASSSNFTFLKPPQIDSFTPTSGKVGITVVIKGKVFKGATTVAFNGVPSSSFLVKSDREIQAVVPAGATTGKISVTTPGGTASSSATFTVLP